MSNPYETGRPSQKELDEAEACGIVLPEPAEVEAMKARIRQRYLADMIGHRRPPARCVSMRAMVRIGDDQVINASKHSERRRRAAERARRAALPSAADDYVQE